MRLASVEHHGRLVVGAVIGELTDSAAGATIADLTPAYSDMITLLRALNERHGPAAVERAIANASSIRLADCTFLPPVPTPRRILCVGTNYADHIAESDRVTDRPDHPMIFTRFPSSLVGHGEPLVRPIESSAFDFEGELAVVIARHARRVAGLDALTCIAGYSCFMDGTLRDWQRHTSQFIPGKNFQSSGSFGPWITTADEIVDPHDLQLTTMLDGIQMQSASTKQLVFDISEIISYCSAFTTLEPGDVIATGTPGGVGYARNPPVWLEPGSTISVNVPGVGQLSNPIVQEDR